MDLVAGLHWLRENIPAFGGDPERITLLGHGTGAALGNIIAVSPVAKGTLRYGHSTAVTDARFEYYGATPCGLVDRCQHFGGNFQIHLQDNWQ